MGRCALLAWETAVESQRQSSLPDLGVSTGHILLGVLKEDACAGGLILAKLGLDLKLAFAVTEFVLLHGRRRAAAQPSVVDWAGVPHTASARAALDLALEEANLFSDTYPIGTEHLLLGVLRVPDGTGCQVLHYLGIHEAQARAARAELWQLLRSED
jgi:hypothetical protein